MYCSNTVLSKDKYSCLFILLHMNTPYQQLRRVPVHLNSPKQNTLHFLRTQLRMQVPTGAIRGFMN